MQAIITGEAVPVIKNYRALQHVGAVTSAMAATLSALEKRAARGGVGELVWPSLPLEPGRKGQSYERARMADAWRVDKMENAEKERLLLRPLNQPSAERNQGRRLRKDWQN